MRPSWKKCVNCVSFEVVGDRGECRRPLASVPTLAHNRLWPPVSADDWCESFSYNPEPLLAEVERLYDQIERQATEIEETRMLCEQLSDEILESNGRKPLPTI